MSRVASIAVLVGLLTAVPHPRAAEAQVRAWEEQVVIPTYPLHPDDPNPHFSALEGTAIYPYTMQDHFSTTRVNRSYRAVFLENEYLRVMCLPEIGGRIQSVLDKRTGQEMFHRNSVIKPGHIALRGAWISGGIEWNRGPAGHTVTSFSPVDVTTVRHPDGAASLVIGNTEMNFRTGWEVRLTLRPGRAFLDERIELFNPTDGFHPYYFWNNTAFPDTPGTRFIYPMSLGTDHNGTIFFRWPIDAGRDLSWVKNHLAPTSIFAYQCPFDFFGAYDVDRDYGIVQVANHHELPGKKAWTWGQADGGRVSQLVLTDDPDSRYIEVQSGPLATQADFEMLAPGQVVGWEEWWYPVQGLGDGFEFATKDVAIQRRDGPDGVEFLLASTGTFDGAHVIARRDDEIVADATIDLSPTAASRIVVPGPTEPIALTIETTSGDRLATYESPLPIPVVDPPAPSRTRASRGLEPARAATAYARGYAFDVRSDIEGAREWYERALRLDPEHGPSLRALGVLDAEAGRIDAAAARFLRATESDPFDGMASYLLGVARLRQERLEEAVTLGYAAVKRFGTQALGYGLVGRAEMRLGNYGAARTAFSAGLGADATDRRLKEQLLAATYKVSDYDAVRARASEILSRGSTRLVPRAMLALIGDVPIPTFVSTSRQLIGEDEFEFIELGLFFADLGLYEEATRLLAAATVDTVPASEQRPLPRYFLAYFHDALGNHGVADRYRARAARMVADDVFPSRPETIPILRAAIEHNAQDGRAHLYLGNLYAGLQRLDEAVEQWTAAVTIDPTLSVAHRNLGIHAWKVRRDLDAGAEHLEQAIAARPNDQTLYRDLAQIEVARGRLSAAIKLLETMPLERPRRGDTTLLLAQTYVDARQYDAALRLLASSSFSNREGNTSTRGVFVRAHLERGRARLDAGDLELALEDFQAALTYPPNLNVGRPASPQEAEARYWEGRTLKALGRLDEATDALQTCEAGNPGGERQNEFIQRCREELAAPQPPAE